MSNPLTPLPEKPVQTPMLLALWRLMRPRQWLKNVLVFAPLVFTESFLRPSSWPPTLLAFLGFCLLSSAVYAVNDLHDAAEDRLHPKKCHRPIASGRVSPRQAGALAAVLGILGLGLAALVGPLVLVAALGFLVVNALYTLVLRSRVLVDAFGISAGYLLRAAAGAAALKVSMSPWLFVLVLLLTLFLALGKRRSELRTQQDSVGRRRGVLERYSAALLDQLLAITVSSTIALYAVYSFDQPLHAHSFMLTIPFVVYGLFRYLYLLGANERVENPDEMLVTDVPTLINIGLWGVVVISMLLLNRQGVL